MTVYGCHCRREKLAATLRLLARGESVKSIHLQFRHGQETVRRYIVEVCKPFTRLLWMKYYKYVCMQVISIGAPISILKQPGSKLSD